MLSGAVEIYSNHRSLFIGAADLPDGQVEDAPASAAGARHIMVQTRGQTALTRVSFWAQAMPLAGQIVYDGPLDVQSHRIWVADVEGLTRWGTRVERTGPQRVVVCVDDAGYASRVHVGFGLDDNIVPLTAVEGHPLPPVMASDRADLGRLSELGLILDGHDSPLARLAAALKVMSVPAAPRPYEVTHMLGEWLRRLAIGVTYEDAQRLAEQAAERLRDSPPLTIAASVLREAGAGVDV